jgi:hypothetical protein
MPLRLQASRWPDNCPLGRIEPNGSLACSRYFSATMSSVAPRFVVEKDLVEQASDESLVVLRHPSSSCNQAGTADRTVLRTAANLGDGSLRPQRDRSRRLAPGP